MKLVEEMEARCFSVDFGHNEQNLACIHNILINALWEANQLDEATPVFDQTMV